MFKSFVAAAVMAAAASAADGAIFEFSKNNPQPQNSSGGTISSIKTTFDTDSKAFTWNVSFSDGVAKNTRGYWLAVSDGPNPKGTTKQLAIMYFDASTSLSNPTVSIYRFNGANSNSSFLTPADLLASTKTAGQTVIQASGSDSGGKRTFSLKVNAAGINAMYNASNGFPDWEGIRFGKRIGIWFHPVKNLKTSYLGNKLCKFDGTSGWYDVANECTELVPAPGAVALLGMGGLLVARRRR